MILKLVFLVAFAWAQPSAFEEMVAWDFEMLLHDTVNEGAQYALVALEDGKPKSSCVILPSTQDSNLEQAHCMLEFVVTFEGLEGEYLRECELMYSYDSKDPQATLQGDEELEISCMEILSEFP